MNTWRNLRIAVLLLGAIASGCTDGGRGSSGFDISENAAISRVLETQECLSGDRLTLCPADQMPTPMPTAPTPTAPPGPTETPTPNTTQRIETGLAPDSVIVCTRPDPDAACTTTFSFRPFAFPPDATFRVASRLPMPSTEWTLAAPLTIDAGSEPPLYTGEVELIVPPDFSPTLVQFAVLVFSGSPESIPPTFEVLAGSGANLAFVTPEFALDVVTLEPPRTPTAATPTPSEPPVTPLLTATETPTPTATPTSTPSRTPAAPGSGPELTHLGLARADSKPMQPVGVDEEGRPIYFNLVGQGMTLIVEARPGLTGRPPGRDGYSAGGLPDLQVILSRPLGDGSAAVCDTQTPEIGGIPGTEPLEFADTPTTVAAINDFGCRVNDGTGLPLARVSSGDACTTTNASSTTGFGFIEQRSTTQFCLPIARAWAFPLGDTVVAARVRDIDGALGPATEILVRVGDSAEPTHPCEGDERVMTIARPPGALFSSFTGDLDVSADPWEEGPIRVCIGPEGSDGRRSLRLRHDVTLALGVADGSVLCLRLLEMGSGGAIDCDGGSAHGAVLTQDSNGTDLEEAPVLETGIGGDAGAGAATLTASAVLRLFLPGTPPSRCQSITSTRLLATALTTATATMRVNNPRQGGEVSITASGTSFDCSRLTETDSPGSFALPFPGLDTLGFGDTANVLILSD